MTTLRNKSQYNAHHEDVDESSDDQYKTSTHPQKCQICTAQSTTEDHLSHLSRTLLTHVTTQSFVHPSGSTQKSLQRLLTPDFRAYSELPLTASTPAAYLNHLQALWTHFPSFRAEIWDVRAMVVRPRHAMVWITLMVTGMPHCRGGAVVVQESVIALKWRWTKDGWLCYRHTEMRGCNGFTFG
jgi:hypothetical protein